MALGKNTARVFKIGGGKLSLKELPSGSYQDVGYLQGTKITEKVDEEKVYDETGKKVGTFYGNTDATLTSTLLQTSKEEIDLLRNSSGKTYAARYQVLREDGKVHLFSGYKCVLSRNLELNFDNTPRKLPLTMELQFDETAQAAWKHAETSNNPPLEGDWPT